MAAKDEAGKTTDWEGGSLDDLLALLGEGSWSARIEATSASGPFGVIDVVAGGVSESHAGELRGDPAIAAMRVRPDVSYRVHLRLPNPRTGGLEPPGPSEGTLAERSVASLMRYCEEFVLSCALVLSREGEIARIVYQRGEISATLVDGSDAEHRLPDVMGWKAGTFRIDVEGPTLRRRTGKRPIATQGAPTTLFGYTGPTHAATIAAANAALDGGSTSPAASGSPAGKTDGKPPSGTDGKTRTPEKATPRVGLQAVGRTGADASPVGTARPTPRHPSPATAGSTSLRPTPKTGSTITPVEAPTANPPGAIVAGAATRPVAVTLSKPPHTPPPPAREEPSDWIATTPAPEADAGGLLAAPVIVHALLGVALGGLIVVLYWIYLRNGGTPLDLG